MSSAAAALPPKRRVRKRIWIPSVLLGVLVLAGGWIWWRGTHAETSERNPAAASEGPVTQLLSEGGHTVVRSAILVPAPAAAVWKVVTDYESHPQFIRYIADLKSRKLDDGRVQLIGMAHSRLWGDFPFDIAMTHVEKPAQGEYTATWNEESKGGFRVDRGGWTVKARGNEESLLIFTKEAAVEGFPDFLVRNIFLDRVGAIVESVRKEVAKRTGG